MFEVQGDPAWFCYEEAHYTANLNSLPAPVLTAALRRVIGRSLSNKARTVSALVSHFLSVRSEYALLEDRRLLEVTQSVLVPPGWLAMPFSLKLIWSFLRRMH